MTELMKKAAELELADFGDFVMSTQTPGAQIKPFWLTINRKRHRMNVWHPAAIRMPF